MIKINDFQKNYINHYLLLEKDFEETKPYLTIAEDNYGKWCSCNRWEYVYGLAELAIV